MPRNREIEQIARERKIRPIIRRVVRTLMLLVFCAILGGSYAFWEMGYAEETKTKIHQHFVEATSLMGINLQHVYISGSRRLTLESVQAILPKTYMDNIGVDLEETVPLYAISLDRLQKILESQSWVESVNIDRQLPASLHIEIKERTPAFVWEYKGKNYLGDAKGFLIDPLVSEKPEGFITMVEGNPRIHYLQLCELLALEPDLEAQVVRASWMSNRRWDLLMKSGVLVKLPTEKPEEAWIKLAALEHDKKVLERTIAVLDMRDPLRYYVTLSSPLPEPEKDGAISSQ